MEAERIPSVSSSSRARTSKRHVDNAGLRMYSGHFDDISEKENVYNITSKARDMIRKSVDDLSGPHPV